MLRNLPRRTAYIHKSERKRLYVQVRHVSNIMGFHGLDPQRAVRIGVNA
jgi:hypothetical protein